MASYSDHPKHSDRLDLEGSSERSTDSSTATEVPRTPNGSLSGDSNKENSSTGGGGGRGGGSGSKHRRVSYWDEVPPTPAATPRRLSVNEIPCESNDPIDIKYPDGLPNILFNSGLLSDDPERVVEATIQLKSILRTGNGEDNAKQFVALGGHALLVTVMKKWETHPVIQYRCCASMADFTYHFQNCKSKLNIFSALVQMGGMDLVVGAMSRYAKVESFQYTCMLVIGNLCTDVGRKCMQNHAELFVLRLNGVHLICNAMKQYSANETIQQTGVWLLEVLCALGMAEAPEMKGEALAAVALAVQSFPNNHDLTMDALAFMKKVVK